MNFYSYQRSRSVVTDLCPGCLRFSIFIFSYKTAKLIETKLHMKSQWDGGMKVLFMGFGSNDKIFGMPMYGKKL